jgi:hypothetical protein
VGIAAANLAAATGPEGGAGKGGGPRRIGGGGNDGDGGSGPLKALENATTGSGEGGMGIVLPIILVAATGALLLVWRRRTA